MKRRTSTVRRTTAPWSDQLRALFRMSAGWTPPTAVLVRQNRRTWTFIADFTDDAGRSVRQITRTTVPDRDGCVEVLSEELTISCRLKGRGR